ncbi:MAG TPA: aminopeptidase P family protein [Dehalococcoidia bacterium]|nr:aminopeptidase P family protein [Dehalococcoidia bacterium]
MTEDGIQKGEIKARLQRTRELIGERELGALLVVGRAFYDRSGNLTYLTNHFPPFPTCVVSGKVRGLGHGMLILPAKGDPVLVVDGPEYRRDMVAIDEVRVNANMTAEVKDVLEERKLTSGRVGIAGEDILPVTLYKDLVAYLPGISFEAADDILSGQRIVKSEAEIGLLKKAAQIADAGLEAALGALAEGKREQDICAQGTGAALEAGADFVRYLRVHSGDWSAWGTRWPQATDRKLKKGDMVGLDIIGARIGYQFDVLRSTVLGRANDWQRKLLETSLEATERMIELAKPGIGAEELVEAAGQLMAKAGFGEHFSGFMGHGIGLETVEDPYLIKGVTTELREGMVLCIEPGIFVPGLGGSRIEQEIVIRRDKPELISFCKARLW